MRRGLSQQFRAGLPQWLSSKDSTCNIGDTGSIPGSGRSLEEGMAIHSRILARKVPWMEKPGGYRPWGHKESGTTKASENARPARIDDHLTSSH